MHHWMTLLSGLVESLFFTGTAFGWASLVVVLKVDGYFAGYCVNATRVEDYAVHIGMNMIQNPKLPNAS